MPGNDKPSAVFLDGMERGLVHPHMDGMAKVAVGDPGAYHPHVASELAAKAQFTHNRQKSGFGANEIRELRLQLYGDDTPGPGQYKAADASKKREDFVEFGKQMKASFKAGKFLGPSCGDCVTNGIVQRRSTDGGRTWGEYTWAVSDHSTDPSRPDMDIGGNPSAVYDHSTGKLVLQFVRGLRNKKTQAQTCNPALTNWQQESSDSGLTWSKPVELSKFLGKWAGSLVGPANGIQLRRNSAHKGRLVWCGHWG